MLEMFAKFLQVTSLILETELDISTSSLPVGFRVIGQRLLDILNPIGRYGG